MKPDALLLLAACCLFACQKSVTHRVCEACIQRDGQVSCGRSDTDLEKHPDFDEAQSKLDAGKAACTEIAARKGGGYAGPLYHQAFDACTASVKASDLIRVHCDDVVVESRWNPRKGNDDY